MDLVLLALRLLKEDIQEVVDSIKLVKLQDEGQLSYINSLIHKNVKMWERDELIY